jgi:hypothetical protein
MHKLCDSLVCPEAVALSIKRRTEKPREWDDGDISDAVDEMRERAMPYLKLTGAFIAAALALGLGVGAKAASISNTRPAVEASGAANGLVLKTQTLGMERRHERRMGRHERRMDRQVNRQDRRMDRHDRRMGHSY